MLPAPPPTAPHGSPVGDDDDTDAPAARPVHRRTPTTRATTWLLAGATAAGCAYLAISDPNKPASWYPVCPFKAMTGLDCPGCGITRALHALLTGHPVRALDHNALFVVAAVAAVVWLAVNKVRTLRGRPTLRVKHPAAWGIAAGVVVVAFWVLRNIHWGPFTWLGSGAAGSGT